MTGEWEITDVLQEEEKKTAETEVGRLHQCAFVGQLRKL